ncbi:hypothetical protein BT67DRAFT_343878, partial [Trichocladium antarcticum]
PTHYEVLSLSPATLSASPDPAPLIKRAYRRALLRHHPDKKTPPHPPHQPQPKPSTAAPAAAAAAAAAYTIDQISTAYAALSRPGQRAAYDRALVLSLQASRAGTATASSFQTGIETVDLDDLSSEEVVPSRGAGREAGEEDATRWYRSCRCGNPRGYLFGEADLEDAADLGELMVGCADCSLWLRVHFAVVDEDED